MKNFIFKSQSISFDLVKILKVLDFVQKEQRANRYDNTQILKQLDICVKGLALLVSAPENDMTDTEPLPEGDID